MNFLKLALALATDAPHILPDFVKLWHDIATGKGGIGKVETAIADVQQTVADAAPIAAAAVTP